MINENQEQEINFSEILDKYLSQWRWFLLCVLMSLFVGFVYLRYAKPQYQAETTILVKDEKKGGMLSELSAFSDMGIGGGIKSNLDNEVEILKSRTLIESTVKRLGLNIGMLSQGNVVNGEYYNGEIEVQVAHKSKDFYDTGIQLQFTPLSNNKFHLETLKENDAASPQKSLNGNFNYGQVIPTVLGDFIITQSHPGTELHHLPKSIIITVTPLGKVVNSFKSRLQVNPLSKTSSVVSLTLVDPVKERAEDFLDHLITIYNEDAAADKNFISERTSEFIANRLKLITQELDGVEQDVESFKQANKLTDIESEAKLFIEGSTEYNKKAVEVEIQENVVASLLDFLKRSTPSDLLPANILASDSDASGLIGNYNELVLERNRILKSATTANPTVVKLDQQLASLKSNVLSSLLRLQSTLKIQKRNLNQQEGGLSSKLAKIPVQEREFRVIARQQKVKEELYLYLLQKREETAITLSATESNARVIDAAKAMDVPVSPKKMIIYLAALLIGLLIPFSVIYVVDLLDTKIKSRLDIEGKSQIPFIGDVPTSEDASTIMQAESRSSSAEALRIIRTNLEFMVNRVPDGIAKTIFLTSTFPKEGKTFVSVNLAATFALSGKKVLLIGMDVRNPKLEEYLSLPVRGVTNYLSSKELSLDELIVKQPGYEDFYVLPAGVIPPNPAELLMSKKVDVLFETLKQQYDYIIVDTAPVSLVTDTLLIAKHADTFIYVARANFLEKRMLAIPNGLHKDQKLPNMCILLNDTDTTKGYGYGYGYGVHVQEKPWYKKILRN